MEKNEVVSIENITESNMEFWKLRVIFTAVELDIFSLLSDKGAQKGDEICKNLELNKEAGLIFLDALSALGLIEKSASGVYKNGKDAQRYLVEGSSENVRHIIRHLAYSSRAWCDLTSVIKNGRKDYDDSIFGGGEEETKDFILGMDTVAKRRMKEILSHVSIDPKGSLLDLGGGCGTYAIGFCQKYPSISSTVCDLPTTVKLTEENIAKHKLEGRIKTIAGDFLKDSIGSGYQTIWVSQVIHCVSEESNILLFKKCYSALLPSGQIIIHDFILDDSKASPLFASLFSVHMLICTEGGRTYSGREVKGWLELSGFKDVKIKSMNSQSSIITAFKQ